MKKDLITIYQTITILETATFGKEYEKKEALRLAKRLRTMAKKLLSK